MRQVHCRIPDREYEALIRWSDEDCERVATPVRRAVKGYVEQRLAQEGALKREGVPLETSGSVAPMVRARRMG